MTESPRAENSVSLLLILVVVALMVFKPSGAAESRLEPTDDPILVVVVEVREERAHRAGEARYFLEMQLGER